MAIEGDGDFAKHIGEAEVAALEAAGELRVIEAEQVQQRGVEIMHVDFINGGIESEFVALAEGDAGFDAAAGEPHGEGVGWELNASLQSAAPEK